MNKVLDLTKSDRKALFVLSSEKMGVDPIIIEKDFWVVFVLHHLFTSNMEAGLVFKGGTSLSKGYNVIKRFSEDIDITISRADLGFDIDYEELTQKSHKSRESFLKDIQVASEEFVRAKMMSILNETFASALKESFKLTVETSDKQSLRFFYPSLFDNQLSYIAPSVYLECGVRGDIYPTDLRPVNTYISDYYPEFKEDTQPIPTLSPKRSFFEKATLLHAEFYRPISSATPPRLSRHYYDIYMLSHSTHLEEALQDTQILQDVIRNKDLMFSSSWSNYQKIVEGGINLLPADHRKADTIRDYQNMQVMFFSKNPTFEKMMTRVAEVETLINQAVLKSELWSLLDSL